MISRTITPVLTYDPKKWIQDVEGRKSLHGGLRDWPALSVQFGQRVHELDVKIKGLRSVLNWNLMLIQAGEVKAEDIGGGLVALKDLPDIWAAMSNREKKQLISFFFPRIEVDKERQV